MFRISHPEITVAAGDALFFPADKVCHRAPPLHLESLPAVKGSRKGGGVTPSGERLLVFWFSWEASVDNVPDVDFQLNPWTLHHLTHDGESSYLHNKVSFLSFSSSFFLMLLLSSQDAATFLMEWMDYYPYQHFPDDFTEELLLHHGNLLQVIIFLLIFLGPDLHFFSPVLQHPDEMGQRCPNREHLPFKEG